MQKCVLLLARSEMRPLNILFGTLRVKNWQYKTVARNKNETVAIKQMKPDKKHKMAYSTNMINHNNDLQAVGSSMGQDM